MPSDDELRAAVAELGGLLLGDERLEETLRHVARIACSAIPGCAGASITLVRDGKPHLSVHTDPDAPVDVGVGGMVATATLVAIPLVVRGERIGVLSLRAGDGQSFDEGVAELATMLAAQAATVAANAMAHDAASSLAQQLEEAMASRAVIEQAKGILMARERCSAEEAFDMLRRASQRSNTKLRDIALQIVDGLSRNGTPG
jgi:GAF domain-containing protein